MNRLPRYYRVIRFTRAFFPLQLIFGHLKYNLLSLFYWAFLFMVVSDKWGQKFGLPYLFYSPEYRGTISWLSFMMVGFSIGGFIMAFNMYSYMKLGSRYPFLATLSKPFVKFCLNNSLIPFLFCTYYIIRFSYFQLDEELAGFSTVLGYIAGFLTGVILYVALSILYFFPTSRDFYIFSGRSKDEFHEEPISSFLHKKTSWTEIFHYHKDRTYIYLSSVLKWKVSRSIKHYDSKVLERVFSHNRINASLFEIITVLAFILIGIFREYPFFQLPAGMSMILLMAIILMIFSIFMSWCKYWTYPVMILLFLTMNYLSSHTGFFQYRSYAIGVDYSQNKKAKYSWEEIQRLANDDSAVEGSHEVYFNTLNEWKKMSGEELPKLVVVMTSGGGSRSALWTMAVLQEADYQTNGKMTDQLQMITGASGGMVGASYYRELMLRCRQGDTIFPNDKKYLENISMDLLNGLSFSAFSNDLFIRYQTVNKNGRLYTKDRGYSFEQQLNQNTHFWMDHDLGYYKEYEKRAVIPTMIFSPTIVNDGRRLLICSQSLAFMSRNSAFKNATASYENVDFQSLFKHNSPNDLNFTSVIRMSATFPYVLPMVSLPTYPEIQVMDAGIRDNYGGKITLEYLSELSDWILKNTSGVVIIQIRDNKKVLKGDGVIQPSLVSKLTLPIENMYRNFTKTQDFDQDQLMKIGVKSFSFPVDLITFNMREAEKDRISLSWHLTSQEKIKILNALYSEENQNAIQSLKQLLNVK